MDVLSSIATPLVGIVDLGGPVVGVLLVLSVAAVALSLAKAWQFVRLGRTPPGLIDVVLAVHHGTAPRAVVDRLAAADGPVAPILAGAIAALARGVEPAVVREDSERLAGRCIADMRSGLRWLDVIAQMAPLLGLFGTVLGMIEAFQQLQAAGTQVDPSILAGGIWVALLTTAVGLGVAMPASLVLSAFEGRIAAELANMEDMLTAAFTGAPASAPPTAKRRPVATGSTAHAA